MQSPTNIWCYSYKLSNEAFDVYYDEMKTCVALLRCRLINPAACAKQRALIALDKYNLLRNVCKYIDS